jgi:protein ImuA
MLPELRKILAALERPPGMEDDPGSLALRIPPIDAALGGGLSRGALHEIAAASERHIAAATGFGLAVSALSSSHQNALSLQGVNAARAGMTKAVIWIAHDMALIESGAPCGPGLEVFGVRPECVITVAVARIRDLLWAMEEALRCRAAEIVIGELRREEIDAVALRRLSLAASMSGAVALLLRSAPSQAASTAATRWVVAAAPSPSFPVPESEGQTDSGEPGTLIDVHLVRNRRGAGGAWRLEWSDTDDRFILASTHPQPVAAPAVHGPAGARAAVA